MKCVRQRFLLFLVCSLTTNAMERPLQPSKFPINPPINFFRAGHPAVLLNMFINAERNNTASVYSDSPILDLKEIIEVVEVTLENPKYFELAFEASRPDLYGMDAGAYRKQLNTILTKAKNQLEQWKGRYAQPAPGIKSEQLPAQAKMKSEQQAPLEIEFSNHDANNFMTAWVQTSNDRWEIVRLLPFKDSNRMLPVKDSVIHFYVGSEGWVLTRKDNTMVLAKERLSDRYRGKLVDKYVDAQEIKRLDLRYPAKLLVIINPDSSVSLTQR